MANATKTPSTKKALKNEIVTHLEQSLGKLKTLLGEKKFHSRVNKASELLTKGIKREEKKPQKETASPKVSPVKKKAPVKKPLTKPGKEQNPARVTAAKKAVVQNPKAGS